MDPPTITFDLAKEPLGEPNENLIETKVQDSISSLQNSSQISVSKVNEEYRNSQIQMDFKSIPNQEMTERPNQTQIKEENNDSESSSQSGEEEIKGMKKSSREQKFKRSTNNSHKKFISVARRWLFKNHRGELKVAFENKFHAFRSTRTYFFIILAFIKTIMNEQKQRQFQAHFTKQVSMKILEYEKQIENTTNENLKHFRSDEVTDLKFSIKASDVYFEGDLDKSIECVYKKDKSTIVKKQHYEEALKIVRGIENEFKEPTFLENTIQQFGGKKIRNKSSFRVEAEMKSVEHSAQRENRSRFFFPEMFGRRTGIISEGDYTLNKYTQSKRVIECPKYQNDPIEQVLQVQRFNDINEAEENPINEKKRIKVFIIPQTIKLNLQTDLKDTNSAVNKINQSMLSANNQTEKSDDFKLLQKI